MKLITLASTLPVLSISALVYAAPSPTASADAIGPTQIRTDQDPVYHLYLQSVDGKPVLGPEASAGQFMVSDTVSLVSDSETLLLNVNTSTTESYKPLFFSSTASTTTWTMSGDTIVASGQQNFAVCPISGSSNWDLFLQTGNALPSSSCANWITIHLPCLC